MIRYLFFRIVFFSCQVIIYRLVSLSFRSFQSQEEIIDLLHAAPFQGIIPRPYLKGWLIVVVVVDVSFLIYYFIFSHTLSSFWGSCILIREGNKHTIKQTNKQKEYRI